MLDNVNHRYGYGQQSYSMLEESYGMQNEDQNRVSGMQILPGPCTDSPHYSKPLMFSGNYAQQEDGWQGNNKYQNGWNGRNMHQNGWSGTNFHCSHASGGNFPPHGAFNDPPYSHSHKKSPPHGAFNDPPYSQSHMKFPPHGAFNDPPYSHSHMSNGMMVNAEYETQSTGPAAMRVQATKLQHSSWDNNGFRCPSSNEGGDWMHNGYQEVAEWKSLD